MSYRTARQSKEQKEAEAWLVANREELSSIGLPLAALSSHAAWDDFLATGSVSRPYEFVFYEHLSAEQMNDLLEFLERESGNVSPEPGLLGFLRVRARSMDCV